MSEINLISSELDYSGVDPVEQVLSSSRSSRNKSAINGRVNDSTRKLSFNDDVIELLSSPTQVLDQEQTEYTQNVVIGDPLFKHSTRTIDLISSSPEYEVNYEDLTITRHKLVESDLHDNTCTHGNKAILGMPFTENSTTHTQKITNSPVHNNQHSILSTSTAAVTTEKTKCISTNTLIPSTTEKTSGELPESSSKSRSGSVNSSTSITSQSLTAQSSTPATPTISEQNANESKKRKSVDISTAKKPNSSDLNDPINYPTPQPSLSTPKTKKRATKQLFKPPKETPTNVNPNKRPSKATFASGDKIVSALKDRKKAGSLVNCDIYNDTIDIGPKISAQLSELNSGATVTSIAKSVSSPGVLAVLTMSGVYSDVWNSNLHAFTETTRHAELLPKIVVVLSIQQLDTLLDQRLQGHDLGEYFDKTSNEVLKLVESLKSTCTDTVGVLYLVPDLQQHLQKIRARCNRALRKSVLQADKDGDSRSEVTMPDETKYYELETELQVMYDVDISFSRNKDEFPELLANIILDMGLYRYSKHAKSTAVDASVKVRSKSTILDITMESLVRIQGLTPRIAAALGTESQNLGNVANLLGSLQKYGNGVWNGCLRTFMTCTDPEKNL